MVEVREWAMWEADIQGEVETQKMGAEDTAQTFWSAQFLITRASYGSGRGCYNRASIFSLMS